MPPVGPQPNWTTTLHMLAYLVIREGSKWTDVFRLVEGRTITIGRADESDCCQR